MTALYSVGVAFRNHDVCYTQLYTSLWVGHTHPLPPHTHTLPPHTHTLPPHTVGLLPYNFLGVQAGLLLRDLQLLQVLDVRSTVSLLLAAGAVMTATLTIGRYRRTKSL